MYAGIFPPTVGGAIGSAGVLIIALIKRVPGRRVGGSFYETVLVNAQIFPMIIAGFLFARFILLSGLSNEMMGVITSAELSPYLLMFIVILFYLFIGCVLEFLSMAIITLPIIFPLLTSVGFDPITVLIVIIMLSQIATITPPLGLAVFTIASIGRVKSEEVFKGIIPFFLICLVFTWLLVMFPQLTLWLPNLFYK